MIYSQRKTFGFWLSAGAIAFFTFLTICSITQYYFAFTIIKMDIPNQSSFNFFMVLHSMTCLFFGLILSYRAGSISISCQNGFSKSISFKNLFTRQIKTYSFEELDGYITTRLWHKQINDNRTLCLIKEGRVIRKIDNFFYSNLGELEKGLEDLKYLGFKRMGIANSWKVLFNQPIV